MTKVCLSRSNTKMTEKSKLLVVPFFAAFLFAVSLLPFFASHMHSAELTYLAELTYVKPRDPRHRTADIGSTRYPSASCSDIIAERDDASSTRIHDPNKNMNEAERQQHARYTTTDPPFWISLHKKWFDGHRWGSIMVKGEYYETGITKQFKDALQGQPKGLVIDVGMNIGWFSLLSRKLGHQVAGFEPNPVMHVRICESLALNDWGEDNSVRIFPYGLAEEDAMMNLTTGKNPGQSSFDETRLAPKFRKTLPVQVVTLDGVARQEGWLERNGPIIHLLKVDVEGYELHVFRGAKKLIQSSRVDNVLMESQFHDKEIVCEVVTLLVNAGYHLKMMSSFNGDPYHTEIHPAFNAAINGRTINLEQINSEIEFIAKVTSNLWWTRSP